MAALSNYYANLLILQYLGKPKAYAHIQALAGPVIMDQLPSAVQNAFNLIGPNTAVGVQLDILGKYAGVSRTSGLITLNDTDFLSLIRMAIIQNNSGSSLQDIQLLLDQFFSGEIYVIDYANMHLSYLISESVGGQDLITLFIRNNLLPRPMGVAASVIYAPIITTFFGFRTYLSPNPIASPFNSYTDYETDRPWISYANAFSG